MFSHSTLTKDHQRSHQGTNTPEPGKLTAREGCPPQTDHSTKGPEICVRQTDRCSVWPFRGCTPIAAHREADDRTSTTTTRTPPPPKPPLETSENSHVGNPNNPGARRETSKPVPEKQRATQSNNPDHARPKVTPDKSPLRMTIEDALANANTRRRPSPSAQHRLPLVRNHVGSVADTAGSEHPRWIWPWRTRSSPRDPDPKTTNTSTRVHDVPENQKANCLRRPILRGVCMRYSLAFVIGTRGTFCP
jgi:hypothetical protein